MSLDAFPKPTRAVYIGKDVWLHVKVLDLTDALKSAEGIEAAVSVALQAREDTAEKREQAARRAKQQLRAQLESMKVLNGVARASVVGFASSPEDTEPRDWQPLVIVANATDEDRSRNRISIASLDQISASWSWKVGDVALEAAVNAMREVAPLPEAGT